MKVIDPIFPETSLDLTDQQIVAYGTLERLLVAWSKQKQKKREFDIISSLSYEVKIDMRREELISFDCSLNATFSDMQWHYKASDKFVEIEYWHLEDSGDMYKEVCMQVRSFKTIIRLSSALVSRVITHHTRYSALKLRISQLSFRI